MTVLEVLQSTTAYFVKRKVESPRLNAEHLMAHALDRKRIELYLDFERVLTETELAPLRELVRRRGQGEPLQHLLGTVEFCGHIFLCDKRALIPRPETEELVELLLKSEGSRARICDVGTGSGVIALSLAAALPNAEVCAIDFAEEALSLARENATRLGLSERVRFIQSDLLAQVAERFDLIVANLPYVPETDRTTSSREVLHDPHGALFGGQVGDEIIRKLIEAAPAHLQPGGLLALEIGINQAEGLSTFLADHGYHDISGRQDFDGVTRFLLAKHG
ncbi:MAG TPA: peptide chain release factor N(5)-glutamine methyltransferase [Pyrinomonadaceae bacterium]|nr:peptide chain release factor N(5)-glutamine methyltransferase [Pyrinomonadaceae bacterium]